MHVGLFLQHRYATDAVIDMALSSKLRFGLAQLEMRPLFTSGDDGG